MHARAACLALLACSSLCAATTAAHADVPAPPPLPPSALPALTLPSPGALLSLPLPPTFGAPPPGLPALPPIAAPSSTSQCGPLAPTGVVRKVDGLVVHSPARTAAPPPGLRMRTQGKSSDGTWFGPEVPAFVPLEAGKTKLDLLDPVPGGWLAVYREPSKTCGYGTENPKNRSCAAEVKLFDCAGRSLASVSLGAFMSRPSDLEVQDVRYDGGTLYFNEACQSYSHESGGRCSSLVAVDPVAKRLLWRTGPLVSNNWFVVASADYLVSAYGFTGEPASIRVVRRRDGAIVHRQPLRRTNFEMTLQGDVVSVDHWHDVGRARFRMQGFDTASPRLVRVR